MSQSSCCVPGCTSTSAQGVSLHHFPNPDTDLERFRTWVIKIGGDIVGLDNHYIFRNRRVCSLHFHPMHIYTRKLSTLAIPQLRLLGVPVRRPHLAPIDMNIGREVAPMAHGNIVITPEVLPSTSQQNIIGNQAKVSLKLWGEAVNTANYLSNRSINSAIANKTPFELWVGRKPCINHLYVFGSKTYVLIKGKNGHKFAPKAIPGIFVGYSETSKAFRIFIPSNNKIFISKDTRVMKTMFYNEQNKNKLENHYDGKILPKKKAVEIDLKPITSEPTTVEGDIPPFAADIPLTAEDVLHNAEDDTLHSAEVDILHNDEVVQTDIIESDYESAAESVVNTQNFTEENVASSHRPNHGGDIEWRRRKLLCTVIPTRS